jgi:alpha-L-fucosidase
MIVLIVLLSVRPALPAADSSHSSARPDVTTPRAGESVQAFEARRARELAGLHWGMFICWSLSTFSGHEWTPGVSDISLFRATHCDTDQWARTARDAGMGYILFLTKHHDGFCLWDTHTTDRKVTHAPLGKDVLAMLRKSCDKYGIKLALYFSEGEFPDNKLYHPGGYTPELKKAQLKELLTEYGPIQFIWLDHAQGDGGLSHQDTVAFVKSLQSGCFVGFNNGPPAGDIRLGEMGHPAPLDDLSGAGFASGDMKGYNGYRLAEFTYPILPPHDGGAMWFYSLPKYDALCYPASKLYHDYLGAVQCGNIFSLDVGPDYNGRLRKVDVATLKQVGRWIHNPASAPRPALSQGKPATASSTWPQPGYEAAKAFDGDESTRWGAAADARSGWIQVDLGQPTRVGRAVVEELAFHRTQEFAIEYHDGDAWKAVVKGTTIAGDRTFRFRPVTARIFRLNILKASEVPTIEEFQLFPPGR